MPVIRPNAVAMKAEEKRDRILSCLREVRCPMTAGQVRDRLYSTQHTTITEKEVARQLHLLEVAGKVEHPSPENTAQFQAVRR